MTSQLLSAELRKSLEAQATRYQEHLWVDSEGEAALAYLSGRGLPGNVVRDYRLGLVAADDQDNPDYAGWISIPYLTRAGVVGFKLRNISGYGKKYINPGHDSRLFNTLAMDAADRTGIIAICEGEFDAIVMTALVGIPAVGIPGVDSYAGHKEWRELLRGYEQVLIFEDQDEPKTRTVGGKEETYYPGRELTKKLKADIDTARVVRLPAKDVNDCYLQLGRDAILGAAGLL